MLVATGGALFALTFAGVIVLAIARRPGPQGAVHHGAAFAGGVVAIAGSALLLVGLLLVALSRRTDELAAAAAERRRQRSGTETVGRADGISTQGATRDRQVGGALRRDPAGRSRTKTFPTKSDATAWRHATEADLGRGQWVDPAGGHVLFGEWAERVRATTVNLRPSSHGTRRVLLPDAYRTNVSIAARCSAASGATTRRRDGRRRPGRAHPLLGPVHTSRTRSARHRRTHRRLGTWHIDWDDGHRLGLVPEADSWRTVTDEEDN